MRKIATEIPCHVTGSVELSGFWDNLFIYLSIYLSISLINITIKA